MPLFKCRSGTLCLQAAGFVERYIRASLRAAHDVPVGFAVAHKIPISFCLRLEFYCATCYAIPHRYLMPPPNLTRYAPVAGIFKPVQIYFFPAFRVKAHITASDSADSVL